MITDEPLMGGWYRESWREAPRDLLSDPPQLLLRRFFFFLRASRLVRSPELCPRAALSLSLSVLLQLEAGAQE